MKPSALLFLKDNIEMMKIVLAWPYLNGKLECDKWAEHSGVLESFIKKNQIILFSQEIITKDGKIDPLAEQFISNEVAKSIRKNKQ